MNLALSRIIPSRHKDIIRAIRARDRYYRNNTAETLSDAQPMLDSHWHHRHLLHSSCQDPFAPKKLSNEGDKLVYVDRTVTLNIDKHCTKVWVCVCVCLWNIALHGFMHAMVLFGFLAHGFTVMERLEIWWPLLGLCPCMRTHLLSNQRVDIIAVLQKLRWRQRQCRRRDWGDLCKTWDYRSCCDSCCRLHVEKHWEDFAAGVQSQQWCFRLWRWRAAL